MKNTNKKVRKMRNSLRPFIFMTILLGYISCGGVGDLDDLEPLISDVEVASQGEEAAAEPIEYSGNLVNVLGDVKQAQIRNLFQTQEQIENILIGYKELGVNGIRITIFPEGEDPNPELFEYLYVRAKEEGFKIYANPALWDGAKRIANKVLHGTIIDNNNQGASGPTTLNVDEATDIVIQRLIDFANEYEVDWINPFNEDGRPGAIWSVEQMNKLYSELYNNVNGAELIGPCTWGISAGTEILQQTEIQQYITVAATHNLGFDHDDWVGFIDAAGELPVWDSEVNNNMKFSDRLTRIDAALEAGVDGLVLYDSWRDISLSEGSLNNNAIEIRNKISQ